MCLLVLALLTTIAWGALTAVWMTRPKPPPTTILGPGDRWAAKRRR